MNEEIKKEVLEVDKKTSINKLTNPLTDEEKKPIIEFIRKHMAKKAFIYCGEQKMELLTTLAPDHIRMVRIGWIVKCKLQNV